MVAWRRNLVFLGLCAVGCMQAVRSAGETRGAENSETAASSHGSTTDGEGAAVNAEASPLPAPLDLRQFSPLLAEPDLQEVRKLIDTEKSIEAAEALESVLASSKLKGLERRRREYLLGLLSSENEMWAASSAAFRTASSSEWLLREDALLHVAEIELELAHFDSALLALSKLDKQKESLWALGIVAACQDGKKDFEEAAKSWRRVIARSSSPSHARLALGATLLQLASVQADLAKKKELAEEAASEARLARLGLGDESAVSKKSAALIKEARALGAAKSAPLDMESQLAHLRGLVDARDFEEALEAASSLSIPQKPRFSATRCEHDYLVGKSLAGLRRWGEGADKIGSSAEHCVADKKLHAWLLFNAGKYSAADGRDTKAVAFYAELERLYPENSLADDARLRAAKSYKRAGVPARFVSLLSSLPEDYPEGDMTMEGVLLLALNRMERHDWSGAAQVLSRAADLVRGKDSARGHEHAGTERYFLARCQQELGKEEEALKEFEEIVIEVPLSYYMLHAYSRLLEADPERARAALSAGLQRATKSPFEFPHRPEYETFEFLRGMELLRVSETARGQTILSGLGLGEGADDSLLWGVALLYDRAGDAHRAHGIARGRLTDWFSHYPEGDWQGPWQIGFPRPYYSAVQKEAVSTGVDEWLIYGVMREESTFRPRVVSHANAYGLMQIIPATARGIGKKYDLPYSSAALKRPASNIAIGSRVLKELNRRFRTNPWLAIPGYNAGPGRPARWLRERPNMDFDVWVEMIPYRETRRYTKRVLASRAAYAFVYYREQAQTALVLPKRLSPP